MSTITNSNGLTYTEFLYAAGLTASREAAAAWTRGEDPTDHRATLNALLPVVLPATEADDTLTVPVSECSVIYLNAGNDRNGNPRRIYVLNHPTAGFLAVVDEGYDGQVTALSQFDVTFESHETMTPRGLAAQMLRARVTPCIDCAPSYRTRLLSKAFQAKLASRAVTVVL